MVRDPASWLASPEASSGSRTPEPCGYRLQTAGGCAVLTPSTPFAYPLVVSGHFASFRAVKSSVSAGHAALCAWFDSRQLHCLGKGETPGPFLACATRQSSMNSVAAVANASWLCSSAWEPVGQRWRLPTPAMRTGSRPTRRTRSYLLIRVQRRAVDVASCLHTWQRRPVSANGAVLRALPPAPLQLPRLWSAGDLG